MQLPSELVADKNHESLERLNKKAQQYPVPKNSIVMLGLHGERLGHLDAGRVDRHVRKGRMAQQMDGSRTAEEVCASPVAHGGTYMSYMPVSGLQIDDNATIYSTSGAIGQDEKKGNAQTTGTKKDGATSARANMRMASSKRTKPVAPREQPK
jgi:hypothetical protein